MSKKFDLSYLELDLGELLYVSGVQMLVFLLCLTLMVL
ncbi:hypothetical protein MCGE09_00600 [Thaumarchaeota archaeon SCGC AB-539-E09]|nr:hypothetical protein MCGE09_00600 [Thaumarchaeota archaeon SCGC AB-539-E09]